MKGTRVASDRKERLLDALIAREKDGSTASGGRWASAVSARSKNETLSQLAMRESVRVPASRQ